MTDTHTNTPIHNPFDAPIQRDFTPANEFLVDDLDTLKVLADPLRLRILELMDTPCTVKQVADVLDMPPTKLYYHINKLETHGLIVVVETRIVSGIIEKHYQVVARRMQVASHLLSPGGSEGRESLMMTVNTLLEDVRSHLQDSLQAGTASMDEEAEPHQHIGMYSARFHLTPEQIIAYNEALAAVAEKYENLSNSQEADDAIHYKVMYAGFPVSTAQNTKKTPPDDSTTSDG